jgi:PIN domain nuclease of toxin-antitoxin system
MLLLDTCAYLWHYSAPELLPKTVRRKIEKSERFAVSLASVWEVAIKVQVGKLRLDLPVEDWVRRSLGDPSLSLLPITPTLAVYSTQLPAPFHKDPFDRIIVATAIQENLTVVTRDERILGYPNLKVLAC